MAVVIKCDDKHCYRKLTIFVINSKYYPWNVTKTHQTAFLNGDDSKLRKSSSAINENGVQVVPSYKYLGLQL